MALNQIYDMTRTKPDGTTVRELDIEATNDDEARIKAAKATTENIGKPDYSLNDRITVSQNGRAVITDEPAHQLDRDHSSRKSEDYDDV